MSTLRMGWLVAVSSMAVLLLGPVARAAIVYDNSSNDLTTRFNPGSLEVGDEVNLVGIDRLITAFTFEYYGVNLSGDEFAMVRFYANDGQPSYAGPPKPGSVLWNSGIFPIGETNRATLAFDLSATPVLVPDTFTWSVQFSLGFNVEGAESAGVDIYSPPTVGSSFRDYWEHTEGDWFLKTNGVVDMNFAARIGAVPEPSAIALFGMAGLALALAWKRRMR